MNSTAGRFVSAAARTWSCGHLQDNKLKIKIKTSAHQHITLPCQIPSLSWTGVLPVSQPMGPLHLLSPPTHYSALNHSGIDDAQVSSFCFCCHVFHVVFTWYFSFFYDVISKQILDPRPPPASRLSPPLSLLSLLLCLYLSASL